MTSLYLPPSPKGPAPGGQSSEERAWELRRPLCDLLIMTRATIPYTPGPRGWAYLLEGPDTWGKGDFDLVESRITDARKAGQLPLDIVCVDETRVASGLVTINRAGFAATVEQRMRWAAELYRPIGIEEFTGVHIELWVEKLGLQSLYTEPAEEYTIPITVGRGRPDVFSRVALLKRCAAHERNVVLMVGDHDVAGLNMTTGLEKNLRDVFNASGLPDWPAIEFNRIGLNVDQIEGMGLTWVDNLQTGGKDADNRVRDLADPKHPHHKNRDVQDYIERFGARKCEADALAKDYEGAWNLLHDAVAELVDPLDVDRWRERLAEEREAANVTVEKMLEAAA